MKDIVFIEGELPSGYTCTFLSRLFNTQPHRRLQSETGWVSYYALHAAGKKAVAAVHFHVSEGLAKTPFRSPFGSIECSSDLPPETLYDFITFFTGKLEERKVSRVEIKAPPLGYDLSGQSLIAVLLVNHGFAIRQSELTCLLNVDERPFSLGLNNSKKHELKSSRAGDLVFQRLKPQAVEEAYRFLASCKREKGYFLSMSLEDLKKSFEIFPDDFFLFGVRYNNELVAASVVIKVTEQIAYHFIFDHVRRLNNLRPGLLLLEGIYHFCCEQDFKIFDLGTSALGGKPNFLLLEFKVSIGGRLSPKFLFEKDL